MTDAIGDFVGNADIGKAFDTFVAQALFQTDFGGRGFGVHLRKFAFQTGKCDGQAWKEISNEQNIKTFG